MNLTLSSDVRALPEGADWSSASLEARLVAAALARLETVPAEELSMRRLAADLGVSHQAPYTHFGSRTRFLAAVAGAGLAEVVAGAQESVERAGQEPFTRMAALGDSFVTFIESRPHLFDLAYGPAIAMRDHRVLQTAAISYWTLLKEVVGACQPPEVSEAELLNRCEIAASTVYGIARMGVHGKIPGVVPATPRQLVASALRTLYDGWNLSRDGQVRG